MDRHAHPHSVLALQSQSLISLIIQGVQKGNQHTQKSTSAVRCAEFQLAAAQHQEHTGACLSGSGHDSQGA